MWNKVDSYAVSGGLDSLSDIVYLEGKEITDYSSLV